MRDCHLLLVVPLSRTDIAYLPGKQRPCCMYCTAHMGQEPSSTKLELHARLLMAKPIALEMSSPKLSEAYTAQSVCSPAAKIKLWLFDCLKLPFTSRHCYLQAVYRHTHSSPGHQCILRCMHRSSSDTQVGCYAYVSGFPARLSSTHLQMGSVDELCVQLQITMVGQPTCFHGG